MTSQSTLQRVSGVERIRLCILGGFVGVKINLRFKLFSNLNFICEKFFLRKVSTTSSKLKTHINLSISLICSTFKLWYNVQMMHGFIPMCVLAKIALIVTNSVDNESPSLLYLWKISTRRICDAD